MDVALARYIRALRAAGAEISTAEAIDAARAVAIVGYSERTTLKDTLSVVLAKSEDEKAVHDRLFDLYFSRTEAQARADGKTGDARTQDGASGQPEAGQPGQQDGQGQNAGENAPGDPQGAQPRGDEAAGDPSQQPGGQQASGAAGAPGAPSSGGGSGQGGGASSSSPMPDSVDALVALANSGDADRLGRTIARAAEAAGVDDIRFESQTAYYVRRTLVHMGIEALEERMLGRMRERTDAARAEVQRLMDARSSLQRQVRAHVAKRFELFGRGATDQFMNEVMVDRSIGQLGARDIERLKAVVARMAKRLAVRHSRRRRIHERGRLDLRRTLRANAGYDGTPVELVWKTRRKDRPKIVAVCDVSGSVAPYVRFLLLFLYALNEKVTDLRTFAFSSRLQEVSQMLSTRDFEGAMRHILDRIGGGSTDYGQALVDLEADHWDAIDGRTTLLILGDGRSNNSDPRIDLFREAAERAKRVVWLSPEPPARWGTGDSALLRYRPFCSHLSYCATPTDIERAIDDTLQAYD